MTWGKDSDLKLQSVVILRKPSIRCSLGVKPSSSEFEALFRQYFQSLAEYAYTIVGDAEVARDVVCDVFAGVWQSYSSWNPPAGSKAYLITAVRNRCLNAIRNDRHRSSIQYSGDDLPVQGSNNADLLDQLSREEQLSLIRNSISEMPPLRREAMRLRWVEKMGYRDIARIMGISENAVQQHVSLALKSLRARFGGAD